MDSCRYLTRIHEGTGGGGKSLWIPLLTPSNVNSFLPRTTRQIEASKELLIHVTPDESPEQYAL